MNISSKHKAIGAIAALMLLPLALSAQCDVTATAYPTTVCAGDPVTLTSSGSCGYLMYNDFNNGTPGAGWVATTGVSFANPCNPTSDGTIYLWMGDAVPIPRTLTTVDFNVNGACEISFDMKYSIQSNSTPCEGIDEMDEGITLQYSTNSGGSWSDIAYFRPDGVILAAAIAPGSNNTPITTYNTPFTVWNNYSFPVPPAAQTPSTRFRWIQQAYSSQSNDHWGLDNIEILCPANVDVLWSHGPTVFDPPTVYPTHDTTYTVTVTDLVSGQSATDSVFVDVKPVPTSTFTVESPVCTDELSTIGYTGNGSSVSTFNWLFSGGTVVSGTGAGPYELQWPVGGLMYISLEVTDSGCTSPATYDSVLVSNTPNVSFTGDIISGCEPITVNFTDNSFPNGATWNWSFGDGGTSTIQNPTHTFIDPGQYDVTLIVSTPQGCDDTLSVSDYINVFAQPIASITPVPAIGKVYDPLINFLSGTTNAETWWWDFGDGSTSTSSAPVSHSYPPAEGSYLVTLIVATSEGCADTTTVTIDIIDDVLIFPNVMTPDNGDGFNDMFVIFNGEKYIDNSLVVYNRWGTKVFEADFYQNDWDGDDCASGTYYYIFKYNVDKSYQGTLTILR